MFDVDTVILPVGWVIIRSVFRPASEAERSS